MGVLLLQERGREQKNSCVRLIPGYWWYWDSEVVDSQGLQWWTCSGSMGGQSILWGRTPPVMQMRRARLSAGRAGRGTVGWVWKKPVRMQWRWKEGLSYTQEGLQRSQQAHRLMNWFGRHFPPTLAEMDRIFPEAKKQRVTVIQNVAGGEAACYDF